MPTKNISRQTGRSKRSVNRPTNTSDCLTPGAMPRTSRGCNLAASPRTLNTLTREQVVDQSAADTNSKSTTAAVPYTEQKRRFPGREEEVILYHYNENFQLSDVRNGDRVASGGASEGSKTLAHKEIREVYYMGHLNHIPAGASNAPTKLDGASGPALCTRTSSRRRGNISPVIPGDTAKSSKYTWDHMDLKSTYQENVLLLDRCPLTMDIDDPLKNLWSMVNKYSSRPVFNERGLTLQLAEKVFRVHGIETNERSFKAVAKFLNLEQKDNKRNNRMAFKDCFIRDHPEDASEETNESGSEDLWDGPKDNNIDEKESYQRFLQTGKGELTPRSDFDSMAVREMLNRPGFINSLFDEKVESISPPLPPKRQNSVARAKAIFKSLYEESEETPDLDLTPTHAPAPEVSNVGGKPLSPPESPGRGNNVESSSESSSHTAEGDPPTPTSMASSPVSPLASNMDNSRGGTITGARCDPHTRLLGNGSSSRKNSKKRSLEESSDPSVEFRESPPPKKQRRVAASLKKARRL